MPLLEKYKIRLGLENHKDRTVDELVAVLKRYSSPYLGSCLDFGNNIALLDDPMDVVQKLAPYVVTTHLKDVGVEPYGEGFLLSELPLGEGFLDLSSIVSLIRAASPNAHLMLEMITRDPLKVPCLTDKYWADLPGAEWPLSGKNPEARSGEDGSVEAASAHQSTAQRGASSHGARQCQSLHGLCEETQLGLMKCVSSVYSFPRVRRDLLEANHHPEAANRRCDRRRWLQLSGAAMLVVAILAFGGSLFRGTGRTSACAERCSHPKLAAAARERRRKGRENTYIPRTGSCSGQAGGGPWKQVVRSRLWLLPWGKRPRGQRPESASFRSGASRREGRVDRSGDPQWSRGQGHAGLCFLQQCPAP